MKIPNYPPFVNVRNVPSLIEIISVPWNIMENFCSDSYLLALVSGFNFLLRGRQVRLWQQVKRQAA